MTPQRDVILLIDDDPDARSLLREQVFDPDLYEVVEAADGPDGLLKLRQHHPDLIMLDLQLAGLSGRDMLIGLKSQGFRGPLIVMSDKGSEKGIIEAFRMGATDYLNRPLREAEVLAMVERGLADTHLRRQHESLTARVGNAEVQLEAREHELDRLYQIGHAITALRDQRELFNLILHAAVQLGGADYALLLLRDDTSGKLVLRTGHNMPMSLADRVGEPVQDALADLVMTSREILTMTGDSLRRFQIPKDVSAVTYLPLVVQTTSIGVLAMGSRSSESTFNEHRVRLLRLLSDYAAVGVINVRLFDMVKQRARTLESVNRDWQTRFAERERQIQAVNSSLTVIEAELLRLAHGKEGHVPPRVGERLLELNKQARQMLALIARTSRPPQKTDS
jgi:DNA-binding response OmpR family regulator